MGLALIATLAVGADYVWNQSQSTDYSDCLNWDQPNPPNCDIPETTSDRAIIEWDEFQDWMVSLIGEYIDELVVRDNVDFTSDDETVTFAAKLTIDAEDGDVEVTIGNATIIAVP